MSTTTRTPVGSRRADIWTGAAALGLFATASIVGALLYLAGRPVLASAAPLYAHWLPHVGPGTPLAVGVAGLVMWRGPELAARLPWRRLLAAAYGTATAWILALALVDGWQRGLAGRLTTSHEYLHEVPGITDIPAMLRTFTTRILDFQPDSWTTHVSAHPPGALLVFVGLDRIGLGGGGWAALTCVLAGALTAVAIPQTVRMHVDEATARATVPFVVLFPGAVWIGASADGLFAGVAATGVALVAVGLVRRVVLPSLLGGVVLGFGVFLSYGLVLLAPVVFAAAVAVRRWRPLMYAGLGAAAVPAAFTWAGFWWPDGYHLLVERYYQGIAADRPYAYWIWANLAILAVSAGPAAFVILRRASTGRSLAAPYLLPLAAASAILAADLSGLSKAEVERIWLPFGVWLMAGAALLPSHDRRGWLAVQAGVALLANHLLLTTW
jgi:methylthioxylose transferase